MFYIITATAATVIGLLLYKQYRRGSITIEINHLSYLIDIYKEEIHIVNNARLMETAIGNSELEWAFNIRIQILSTNIKLMRERQADLILSLL